MQDSTSTPIRSWDQVFKCIDRIVADPRGNTDLIKALNVNLRVETGSLPEYQGSGFADKADSIGLSKQMREKLEALMSIDLSSGDMYLLVRQLVKSLPFFGASQDEIRTIRGLAEEIEYTFPCPITEDIRGEIHSKLSPRNLDFVRALLSYAKSGDRAPLQRINKYQKVLQYQPEKFHAILSLLEELEIELANVFEPHPGKVEDRISDIYQLLANISQIVSPQINNYLRYLSDSIEKKNESLIQTNLEILHSLIEEAIATEGNADFSLLFQRLKDKLDGTQDNRSPEEILVFTNQWRRDVVSFFFPSLFDSLEKLIGHLRTPDALKATLMLGELRIGLKHKVMDSSIPPHVRLETMWLDLTLERIGYILFGEVGHMVFADVDIKALPMAIDVIQSMILSVCAKGQGTAKLEEYSRELSVLKHSTELNFYTVYSIVERINAEIGAITDHTVDTYYDITREIFVVREIPHAEEAASAFVDGLFRETTLQHLSELTLKLLSFSRTRIADLMKRVRRSVIREISPRKVARIQRDFDALAKEVDPSRLAYFFRPGEAEGGANYYPILGEKGANLAELARLGANVPPGFTFTSKVCNTFFSDGHVLGGKTQELLFECVERLEGITECELGSPENPLLLALRAGSCVSMPGMMDTILNIGLNDETVEGLSRMTEDPLFAYGCYFRLISKYSSSVLGFAREEGAIVPDDYEICSSLDEMRDMIADFLKAVVEVTGSEFPQDAREQLLGALKAIFSSWQSESSIAYRQIFNIPHRFCTAATVQKMVFGNLGEESCSGVAFSRNPITGECHIFGEYLPCSQGEVLVRGSGAPLPLSASQDSSHASLSLECRFPQLYEHLKEVARDLELHMRDMQDIEFTVEKNTLYLLQTRAAKRTDYAALKIAVDLANEDIIDRTTAAMRLEEADLKQLFLPTFSPSAPKQLMAKGNPAAPGVATGRLAFNRKDAIMRTQAGEKIILVANQTTPEDIAGIAVSEGILTRDGGMTSHAAINSRRMTKPCVTGCQTLVIDKRAKTLRADSLELGENDSISIDGSTGEVFLGSVEIVEPEYPSEDSEGGGTEIARYHNTYLEWKEQVAGGIDT